MFKQVASKKVQHGLVVTEAKNYSTQVTVGITFFRDDLRTTHEEADLIIVQQCYRFVDNDSCDAVKVISDDTDILILACNFFPIERSDINVLMKPTQTTRTVTEI